MTVDASTADPRRLVIPARYAAAAALLCGVHCALTPVVAGIVPFLALSTSVEWGALAVTAGVGGAILLMGPSRDRSGVLITAAVGIVVWAASLLGLFLPIPETVTSPIGSLVFAASMIRSARICRSGECDRCSAGTQIPT